jgi:hypothetical protein
MSVFDANTRGLVLTRIRVCATLNIHGLVQFRSLAGDDDVAARLVNVPT